MEKVVYIFGNGNLRFEDFEKYYLSKIRPLLEEENICFLRCDFRGVDTLMMEFLKTKTPNVTIYHIGAKPRYLADKYRMKVSQWQLIGGFKSDEERDAHAIESCSHFLAIDFNSNEKRKSGTQKNIERCMILGKIIIQ